MTRTTVAADVLRLRRTFASGRTRSYAWRIQQLEAIVRMLQEKENRFADAMRGDMQRSHTEAVAADISIVRNEAKEAIRHLKRWMKPESVKTPPVMGLGTNVEVLHEPLGVALIIGAWNYPIQLTLGPLVAAIAAGNCAILKPSEMSRASGIAVERSVAEYLDPDAFAVVQGGIPETTEVLAERYDYIFFTGSPGVGRIVMRAASEHLTPVTLELGGKSPGIIAKDADLSVAAKRIVQGKYINAGQTCVGVDYVMVDDVVADEFVDLLRQEVLEFYGTDPSGSRDLARIIDDRNYERLVGLMDGLEVAVGGQVDAKERYIAPTVLVDVPADAPIMSEEIFGPLLPVVRVRDMEEAIARVNEGEKPLALYLFTRSKHTQQEVLTHTSSGGACVNDTLTHLAIPQAPFGGVGNSGMGAYHGYHGYLSFTHRRTVLKRTTKLDPSVRYPPYGPVKGRIAQKLS